MADNLNNVYNRIFAELRKYALSCCRYINADQLQGDCDKMQIGYWAYVPYDESGDWEDYLDKNFNPDFNKGEKKEKFCTGGRSDQLFFAYPLFAAATSGTGGNEHTETTL